MIVNTSVARERLTHAAENGPLYFRPIVLAVRDYDVSLCLVPQGKMPFETPRDRRDRPTILFVGDDMHEAKGPDAFHRRSLNRFVKRCRAAAIVSCEPMPMPYAYVATAAAMMRKDAIIIETRQEHEADWKAALEAANPDLFVLIATVQPMGGVQ